MFNEKKLCTDSMRLGAKWCYYDGQTSFVITYKLIEKSISGFNAYLGSDELEEKCQAALAPNLVEMGVA